MELFDHQVTPSLSPTLFLIKPEMKEKRSYLGQGGEEENTRSSVQNKETTVWRTISMDAPGVLWANWHEQVNELLRGIHGHQKKTLADLSCWVSSCRAAP
jgi:hypothetical protein